MNTIIIERSGDAIADIDKTSKNKWCWLWMEHSIQVDQKKILKNSLWNGDLVTIFYKTYIWKVCNFLHFSLSKRPQNGLKLNKSLKLREINLANKGLRFLSIDLAVFLL